MSTGYQELRAFTAEDLAVTITVEGAGSINGWTLAGHLWDPSGTELAGAVAVAITDAVNRVITATIAGQSLDATAYYASYRFEVARTDAGSRTVVAWGPVEITDPSLSGPPN